MFKGAPCCFALFRRRTLKAPYLADEAALEGGLRCASAAHPFGERNDSRCRQPLNGAVHLAFFPIRVRGVAHGERTQHLGAHGCLARSDGVEPRSVSYTHLTLPTIE